MEKYGMFMNLKQLKTKLFEQQFVSQHCIFMDFEAPHSILKSDQHNNEQTSDVKFNISSI